LLWGFISGILSFPVLVVCCTPFPRKQTWLVVGLLPVWLERGFGSWFFKVKSGVGVCLDYGYWEEMGDLRNLRYDREV
jgi:hypothetical protein